MDVQSQEPSSKNEPETEIEFVPKGITLFLSLMLILYAAYWAYLWYIVTIQRGIGG